MSKFNCIKYSFVFSMFVLAFFCSIFFLSCARYPTIPEIENVEKTIEEEEPPESENIGEIFQEKAPALILHTETDREDYEIGPRDVLEIVIWDHDDLKREVHVSRKGEFSFPLIGKVHADGITVAQLEKKIGNELSGRYVINPQVSITVKEYRSKCVFILGEVETPGEHPLTGETTLVEILTLAGGPTEDAGSEVIVIRPKNHRENPVSLEEARDDEIVNVNLRKLLEGDTSQNVFLEPNDTIYIPHEEYFYVFGEVKKPGRYGMEKGTTVLKAITTAGGVSEKAAINKTRIVREQEGAKIQIPVKMTDPLEPEDIVMVPESFF
ncbi:MAG: polysaccharide biosynthesis/export family protein [Thermodesulfobacteriota bacterium]|nr:polysaccharide biosynthesis/export family protein [Thermodesulfobacteriota bacterium]